MNNFYQRQFKRRLLLTLRGMVLYSILNDSKNKFGLTEIPFQSSKNSLALSIFSDDLVIIESFVSSHVLPTFCVSNVFYQRFHVKKTEYASTKVFFEGKRVTIKNETMKKMVAELWMYSFGEKKNDF